MLKLTIALVAVALTGTASAAGWRSLRVDGSSEASFATSVGEFQDQLSPARYQVFLMALKDVWEQGAKNAEAAEAEYTATQYLRQLDGLRYEQVITLTDPSGDTAKMRLRNAIARVYGAPRGPVGNVGSSPSSAPPSGIRGLGWNQTPQQANAQCGGCYPL